MMDEFLDRLHKYISTAFENEGEFLERFASDMGDLDDLVSCYMASGKTNIVVLAHSGDMITSTIDTLDFINWCDEVEARKGGK